MIKKVLGGLFFAGALLILIGAIANGSLFSDQGSTAATYGNFLGTILPIAVYVLSGVFVITFDNPTKLNYIDGFKKRSKQCSKFIPIISVYAIMMLFAAVGVAASGPSILAYIVAFAPYVVPLIVFVSFFQMYALTHNASKKFFIYSDSILNEYLSPNETFYALSNDNFVLASNKALYFPKLFCVIPFSQITSIKFHQELWEKGVYFNLSNGKKIYVATKHFARIQEAISAYSQVQQ